jgi:nucleolar protein 58
MLQCVADNRVNELIRGIRSQMTSLIDGLEEAQLKAMQLGLGHTLSRYKLKFSPDKVDTMIVQAIGLLDELDKEVNTYAMRVKEWYGWHFPELVKIVTDNLQYAQFVIKVGTRNLAAETDLSDVMAPEVEEAAKESAVVSMGTDISTEDLDSIKALAEQVVGLMEYRRQLSEYLTNRMQAIAPNLTLMVGELVGARLISHAGSLMNLAKQPASTVQILGAEKALFRALKTKHDTPKYGLIYHASLIGQAAPKNKGKISRVLAAKTALSIRVDALGDTTEPTVAYEARAKVEARLRQLEGGARVAAASGAKARSKVDGTAVGSSSSASATAAAGSAKGGYNAGADVQLTGHKRKASEISKSRNAEEEEDDEPAAGAGRAADEDGGKKAKKSKEEKKVRPRVCLEIPPLTVRRTAGVLRLLSEDAACSWQPCVCSPQPVDFSACCCVGAHATSAPALPAGPRPRLIRLLSTRACAHGLQEKKEKKEKKSKKARTEDDSE